MTEQKRKDLRVLFLGGTPRGLELIRALLAENITITFAAILQEDFHEPYQASPRIAEICKQKDIPFCICKKLTPEQVRDIIKSNPDVGFACSWRSILPKEIYEGLPQGCLVAHDSLLPKYRGFAPTSWAIINGEKETGVTLFKIKDGPVDSGEMFGQKAVPIASDETAEDVYPRLIKVTTDLFLEYVAAYRQGKITFTVQDESKATFAKRRTPEDGLIDWNRSAQEIYNLIRALSGPYPPAWTTYLGKKIRIKKASLPQELVTEDSKVPGQVVSTSALGAVVSCGQGQVVLKEILLESGEVVKAQELFSILPVSLL